MYNMIVLQAENLVKAVSDSDMLKVDRMEEIMEKMKQLTQETRAKCKDNQKLAKVWLLDN